MLYSLTDKLNFEASPQIQIKDKIVTVKDDADTALRLVDILDKEGEMQASIRATELLFSEKDQKTIRNLKLNMRDYSVFLKTAIALCLGNDPDEDEVPEG